MDLRAKFPKHILSAGPRQSSMPFTETARSLRQGNDSPNLGKNSQLKVNGLVISLPRMDHVAALVRMLAVSKFLLGPFFECRFCHIAC